MRKKKIEFTQKSLKIEDAIPMFIASQTAKGVSEKTIQTYKGHFRCIGHHIDFSIPFDELKKKDLDDMLVSIRKSGVSPNTLSSYASVRQLLKKYTPEQIRQMIRQYAERYGDSGMNAKEILLTTNPILKTM